LTTTRPGSASFVGIKHGSSSG
jgi:hypothetical protein